MKFTAMILSMFCFSGFGQKNQNLEIINLAPGEYPVHKAVEKGHDDYRFETAKKPWPVDFIKDGEKFTKVSLKRAGIIDESYEADLPAFPAYYKNGVSEIVISVLDEKIYYYTWSVKSGAKIEYILSKKSAGSYQNEKSALDNYRRSVKELQSASREERIQDNAAAAAKEAAENSLEGKDIKNIKLKLTDNATNIGMLSVLSIGIEVELADGKILKTQNLGGKTPYTDFITEVKGGEYAGGDFKVANDSRLIPNDKVEIILWSKFDGKKTKGIFSIPINYKNDIAFQYQGSNGATGRGRVVGYSEHGGNGTSGKSIRMTADKKQVNGTEINHIVMMDGLTGKIMCEAKLNTENKITVNLSGGNGGSGERGLSTTSGNGGNGGSGGNGGNLTLSGTGASVLQITILNNGGRGGMGGEPKNMQLSKGSNGVAGINGMSNK